MDIIDSILVMEVMPSIQRQDKNGMLVKALV
jgi:hypothetical protein